MEKTKKIILSLIIVLIILIIIILAIYINVSKKNRNDGENEYTPIELQIEENVQLVESFNQYFSVQDAIKLYYTYIWEEDTSVYNLLDEEYIKTNNITTSNVLTKISNSAKQNNFYKVEEMYKQDIQKVMMYYVHGQLKESMFSKAEEDTYLIVYVDNYNVSYSIQPITKEEYSNLIKNGKEIKEKTIVQNNYNKYNNVIVNEQKISEQLLFDYKLKVETDIENAYEKLDSEYRSKKYNTVQKFKKSMDNSKIKSAILDKYRKIENEEYTEYVCIDKNQNYYIFKVKSAMNYTVLLDSYTIEIPELVQEYNNEEDSNKVVLNIQKIFQAINSLDYEYVYGKLDGTFKSNNFSSLDKFEDYINKNLFKYSSIEIKEAKNEGDIFIYKIVTNNNQINTAITKDMTIIMKLKEGTDFVMSFSID